MSDAPRGYDSAPGDSDRTMAIIIYVLYLAALVNGLTAFIGVIIAYIKRDEARGSVYESHYTNAIELFWIFFIGMLVAVPLCFIAIGIPLVILLYIYVLYRTIKGLIRAADGRPYW